MTIPSKTLGEQLKYYRNLKGLSQARLAKIAFISKSSVNNYEQGHRTIPIQILFKLGIILDFRVTMTQQGEIELMPHAAKLTDSMIKTLKRDLNGFLMTKSPSTIGELKEELRTFLETHEYGPFEIRAFTPLKLLADGIDEIESLFETNRDEAVYQLLSRLPKELNHTQLIFRCENNYWYVIDLNFGLDIWVGVNAQTVENFQSIINDFVNAKHPSTIIDCEKHPIFNHSELIIMSIIMKQWLSDGTYLAPCKTKNNSDKVSTLPISRVFVKEVLDLSEKEILLRAFGKDNVDKFGKIADCIRKGEPFEPMIEDCESPSDDTLYELKEVLKEEGYNFYKKNNKGELIQL